MGLYLIERLDCNSGCCWIEKNIFTTLDIGCN